MKNSVYNVCCAVVCLGLTWFCFEHNSGWAAIGAALALLSLEKDK
jgi:hypothetical protein